MAKMIAPPIGDEPFTGLAAAPAMMQGAKAVSDPVVAAAETVANAGITEEKARVSAEDNKKAMEFQKVLRGGPGYMMKFADEVALQNPQIGNELKQEAQGLSSLFQDPNLQGDQAEKILTGFYESAYNRIRTSPTDKTALETLRQQNRVQFENVRQQNRISLEGLKARLAAKYGKGGKKELDYQLTMEEATELLTETEKAIDAENLVINDPASTFTERLTAMKMMVQLNKDKAMATKNRWTASQHGATPPAAPGDTTAVPAPAPGVTPPAKPKKPGAKKRYNPATGKVE